MPVIRVLPDRVANQIAAGEVIERPVAVVKELVENSLDASATRIEIEFRRGGKSSIRVDDNGFGMASDSALLSLERHATSKIREAGDLHKVTSFGFRGEALPAIASVSRFTLRTRTEGSEAGTEILINGGRMVHCKDCGMPVGTSIEVAHLFNAVPVRRKFLKTENTEAAHIIHLSKLYAVANPDVSFTLTEDGRTVFQSPVCPGLKDRIAEIFGRQIASQLMAIESSEGGLTLTGMLGRPGSGRSTRHELVTYVNQRPVDSRTLNFALIEAFHTYIPKGRYPLAFIFLEINPRMVDVNVHPAKREVRFHEEARIRQFVIRSVLDHLRAFTEAVGARGEVSPSLPSAPVAFPAPGPAVQPPPPVGARVSPDLAGGPKAPQAAPAPAAPATGNPAPDGASPMTSPPPVRKAALGWRCLGLAHGNYAVFQTDAGIVLMSRRGALERILFEKIQSELGGARPASQKLLFPVPLELDALLSAALEENLEFFRENGFEVEPFGRHFFRIESVPEWLNPASCERFLRDLLAIIRERGLNPEHRDLLHEEIARLAASLRGQEEASAGAAEMVALAESLFACDNPLNDPAGRPTLFEIPHSDLERRFGRP
jgi:DNA mismatch repair protein MutL